MFKQINNEIKSFFLALMYFFSIFSFDKNVNSKSVNFDRNLLFYLTGRVQAYCQLQSVGQLSKENTKIWVDHSFKLSKDEGMKEESIKTIRKMSKKQYPRCPIK